MTRILALLLGGAAALAAATFFFVSQDSGPVPLVGMAEAQSSDAEAAEDATDTEVTDYVYGDPDAPVTMVEYASFTCPHCKNYHLGVWQDIKEKYVDTGEVKVVFREVYGSRPGLWAGMVARCGGEDRYFQIVKLLFERQEQWLDATDLQGIAENLRRIGRTAGLTDEQLDACLTDQAKAEAMIALYQENVTADEVESTPSFVIGGTTYQNMSFERMSELLDAELEE